MEHDFIRKYYYCSKSDANLCIPTATDGATRGRAGQRKGTLSKEERDVINARRRATYKKKKEEQGYQEQKDKLNTKRRESYQKKKQQEDRQRQMDATNGLRHALGEDTNVNILPKEGPGIWNLCNVFSKSPSMLFLTN